MRSRLSEDGGSTAFQPSTMQPSGRAATASALQKSIERLVEAPCLEPRYDEDCRTALDEFGVEVLSALKPVRLGRDCQA